MRYRGDIHHYPLTMMNVTQLCDMVSNPKANSGYQTMRIKYRRTTLVYHTLITQNHRSPLRCSEPREYGNNDAAHRSERYECI